MRWGKPRKNKKKKDPRYFLNEGIMDDMIGDIGDIMTGMGDIATGVMKRFTLVQGTICRHKRMIFLALDYPDLAKRLPRGMVTQKVVGVLAEIMVEVSPVKVELATAREVAGALYKVFGEQLGELATDPKVKPMIKDVITTGCSIKLP